MSVLSNGMFLPAPGVLWRQQAGNDITAGIQTGTAIQALAANALYMQNG